MARKKQQNSSDKKSALNQPVSKDFYRNVREILEQTRQSACCAVNFAVVMAYWEVGRLIVEEEQQGKNRAEYGKRLISGLSKRLTADYGKGFDKRNLFYMRQFYLAYPKVHAVRSQFTEVQKANAPRAELTSTGNGHEVSDQLPAAEKHSALRRELTWTHY